MHNGLIFNIQRFSIHDGPGIRTTIFFKGCPLSCRWCQNPEGISLEPDLFCYDHKCLGCRSCIAECTKKAISFRKSGPVIDRERCNLCLKCAFVCPSGALKAAGIEATVPELVKEILKDRIIFEESGGGATISGGEPLMQPEFLIDLLKALNKENIHTVIETSGYAPWTVLEKVSKYTDLILYDLKIIDPVASMRFTGVSSVVMLDNLKRLIKNGRNVQVRMPIIPSLNDSELSLNLAATCLKEYGIEELELIPYHNFGTSKYNNLGLDYLPGEIRVHSPEQIAEVRSALENRGIKTNSEAG